jgi:hypothetical protein
MDELRKQIRGMLDELADKLINMTIKEGNRMAVVRMREARAKLKGVREGRIPFGEHPAFPKEKEALEFLLGLAKKNTPMRSIAEAMERQGFVTRFQKENWNPGTVHRILRRHGAI